MSNTSEPPERPGGLLPDLEEIAKPAAGEPPASDVLPAWDAPPMAIPIDADADMAATIPLALPLEPLALPAPEAPPPLALPVEPEAPTPPRPTSIPCPACATLSPLDALYCGDCGYYFSEADLAGIAPAAPAPAPAMR